MPLKEYMPGQAFNGRIGLTDAYRPPFAFTGHIEQVTLEIGREAIVRDQEAELRIAMGRE